MSRWWLGLLALPLVACGGDGSDSDRTAETDPAAASASAELAGLFARLSPESAGRGACFGDALLERRTPDELAAAGLLDERGEAPEQMPTLPRADAAAWVDAWFECVDYVEAAGRSQQKATPGLDVPAFEDCLRAALSDEEMAAAATDGLSGSVDSAGVRRLSEEQFTCAQANS